jgi:hypothetical protein
VPHGTITSYDFLYGASKTSLADTLSTLATTATNAGITATTALNNTTSILATIPTLATITYVDNTADTLQPRDATGTLALLPKNISASDTYFTSFPKDQLTWTSTGGASATNQNNSTDGNYQLLNFPIVGSTLTLTVSNNCPSQPSIFSVNVKLGTATSFTLSITYGGITYATAL